jgi:mono/diheme cytochrome c family protein
MPRTLLHFLALVSLWCSGGTAADLPPAAKEKIDFVRDVQSILSQNCWSCHGASKQKAGLRLDSGPAAMQGGDSGRALQPGDSARSLMIQRVSGLGDQPAMPPGNKRLTPKQIGILRAWIDQGADWPNPLAHQKADASHWAFRSVRRPQPPAIKNAAWPRCSGCA